MPYQCPRCGEPVHRGYSAGPGLVEGASRAGLLGILFGIFFSAAFGDFQCKKCGKIAKSEFPPEARTKMRTKMMAMFLLILLVIGAIALAIVSGVVAIGR